jgi:truncated hemoglobin YjbI
MGGAVATIYEWGGGRELFARWLNRFYDLVELEAPEIAAMFGGRVSDEHRTRVTDWWVEVMGGRPPIPSGAEATSICSAAIMISRSRPTSAWRS